MEEVHDFGYVRASELRVIFQPANTKLYEVAKMNVMRLPMKFVFYAHGNVQHALLDVKKIMGCRVIRIELLKMCI